MEPLPAWFCHTVTSPSAAFHTLRKAAHEVNDWGVKADLNCYRALKDALCQSLAEAEKFQADANRYHVAKGLCEAWLEAVCATSSLAHMEGLTPTLARRTQGGWGEQVARRGGWKQTRYHGDVVE